MDAWVSRSNVRKQTAACIGCMILGILIAVAVRHCDSCGNNAAAGFWLGVLLLGLGVIGFLATGPQTVIIDPRTRRITIEDANRLGSKTRGIPFEAVAAVSIGYLGKTSNRVRAYYLVLKLRDGEEYSLFAPGRFFAGASDRFVVDGWRRRLESVLGLPASG